MSFGHPLETTLHSTVADGSSFYTWAIDLINCLTVVCSSSQNVFFHLELQTTIIPEQ